MKTLTFLLVFLFTTLINFAQKPDWQFYRLPLNKGVSLNLTYDMIQDSKGYIWFATMYGLVKYDGKNYTSYNYNAEDTNSISYDDIVSLFEDSKGNLWIGTWGGGLNMLDAGREKFTRFIHDINNPEGISDNVIWSVCEDKDGNIWIGTEAGGLNKFDPDTKKFSRNNIFQNQGTEPNVTIQSLLVDKEGILWIGHSMGLTKYSSSQNEFKPYTLENIKSDQQFFVSEIFEDSNNKLWIGAQDGLYEFNKMEGKFVPTKLIKDWSINSITEDSNGNLLLGTNRGLINYNPESTQFEIYVSDIQNSNTLAGNFVIKVMKDNSGVIWTASYNAGISKLISRDKNFIVYRYNSVDKNSISSGYIKSIAEDSKGNILLGTPGSGVNVLNPTTSTIKQIKFQKNFNNVINTMLVEGNILWIGTAGSIVNYDLSGNKVSKLPFSKPQQELLDGNNFTAMLSDGKNNIWLGTYNNGLFRYDKNQKEVKHYSLKTLADGNDNADYILSLYKDRQDRIWVGSYGGFHLYDAQSDTFFSFKQTLNDPKGLSNNYVYSILEDSRGKIWLGTARGLNEFDPAAKTFKHYFLKDGLPNDVICSIVEDENGNLWLSTNKGISKFNYADKSFQNFGEADGLASDLFLSGAGFISSNSVIYFGGPRGVTSFRPDEIKINNDKIPIIISSIQLADNNGISKKINSDDNRIELDYSQSSLIINFISFDYKNPDRVQYKHKLEGYNNDWIENGTSNTVKFSNLSPGSYKFLVTGTNSDGIWSNNFAEFSFIISPPFWQTWWFIPAIISALILIGFTIHLFTLHSKIKRAINNEKIREEESDRIRQKTAIDFHDELGHRLTRISLLVELIKRKLGISFTEVKPLLEKISENSARLYEGTKDFIWAIDPQKDSLYELMIRLKDFGDEIFGDTEVSFEIKNLEEKLQNAELDMDWKRHLSLIFKEGLNNSLKHSNCHKVSIDSKFENDEFEIILEDDGSGFDVNNLMTGNGLSNMKKRAEYINAKFDIESQPGNGTKISVKGKFPIKSLNYN